MKILYIGVHSHIGWGAEFWLKKAFSDLGIKSELFDYRLERKNHTLSELNKKITLLSKECDLVFLQRGDNLSPNIFLECKTPIIFWSTEPIQLKTDVDQLLAHDIFSWIYIHSYSCLKRIKNEFSKIIDKVTVLHNAAPKEIIKFNNQKYIQAIFNRNLSIRRRYWLFPSKKLIYRVQGKYGQEYYSDLQNSNISINIHYSRKNIDDFESGIFEAMASGCAIISEKLNSHTLSDLGMDDGILQVSSPFELRDKIRLLKFDVDLLNFYQQKSQEAIILNTWHNRANQLKKKFEELLK
ncbi:MAG: hypothetical protein QF380_06205 [Candidatus Marinimicrobia bacterium]|jgi:glycosyltransferase involved in cell wall biosynthesis|nr:hypothetical protein [Candidatus Neomarinimicrobiota bacterium]